MTNSRESIFNIPRDIVEIITNHLNLSDVYSLSYSCHFFYNSLADYKKVRLGINQMDRNLQENMFKKTEIDFASSIQNIILWRDRIIVANGSSITARSTHNIRRILWTNSNGLLFSDQMDIVDDKLVAIAANEGRNINKFNLNLYIALIDLKLGNIAHIPLPQIKYQSINIHDNEIIIKTSSRIYCYNLSGKLVKKWNNPSIHRTKLLVSNKYLIEFYENNLHIINRIDDQNKNIFMDGTIYSASLHGDRLVCNLNDNNIVAINLEDKDIIPRQINYVIDIGLEKINKNKCLIDIQDKKVIIIDLLNYTYQTLDECEGYTPSLAKQGKYSLIKFTNKNNGSFLSIWDNEKISKIICIEAKNLKKFTWNDGKLFLVENNTLTKYDFSFFKYYKEEVKAEVHSGDKKSKCLIM